MGEIWSKKFISYHYDFFYVTIPFKSEKKSISPYKNNILDQNMPLDIPWNIKNYVTRKTQEKGQITKEIKWNTQRKSEIKKRIIINCK